MRWSLGKPSAALVLGTMAGALAAVAFLPTAVPLLLQIIWSNERLGLQSTAAASLTAHSAIQYDLPLDNDLLANHAVEAVHIERASGGGVHLGLPLPTDLRDAACEDPAEAVVVQRTRQESWAVACVQRDGITVVSGLRLDWVGPARRVLVLVILLGLVVGIITALGILRLLRPLSEITGALGQVGAGERGVRMAQTGLAELDELVDRLNAAARSVEDREDGILGRIQVVQEMARIVAHEIRNPLQSLELLTSLIASEEDDNERLEIAASIHAEVRTLEQVVHRLLRESATRGSLRLRVTTQPVAPMVEQVIALRRPQANAQSVRLTMGPVSWTPVPCDQALLKRSIENLVLNALQAVPKNTGQVRVSVIEEGEWMVIIVDDNGPGVPDELQDQVFEANVDQQGRRYRPWPHTREGRRGGAFRVHQLRKIAYGWRSL